jgi:ribosome-associated protein
MPASKKTPPDKLADLVLEILDDLKAIDTVCLDVKHLTPIMDTMIITSGRSDRHVRAIADALVERCKERGFVPLGVEGTDSGEWVLVDFTDVIVHVMLPKTRAFYDLERLWDIARPREEVVES